MRTRGVPTHPLRLLQLALFLALFASYCGKGYQTIVSWQPGWKSSIQARSAAEPWDPPPVMAAAKLLQSKAPEAARWRKVNQPPAAFGAPQWTRDRRSMPPQAYTYPDSFLFTSVAERHGLLWQGAGAEMRGLGSPAWCRPSCPISSDAVQPVLSSWPGRRRQAGIQLEARLRYLASLVSTLTTSPICAIVRQSEAGLAHVELFKHHHRDI